jgi:formamidopyrimidine-DNA glycosylase
MPELPEVQTIVTSLRPRLIGRRIGGVRLLRSDLLQPEGTDLSGKLSGRSFKDIHRVGKKIVITLDDSERFFIHLGMTGRLTIERAAAAQEPHTHLIVSLPESLELRFRDPRRFGGIWWVGNDFPPDAGLGPDALELTAAELGKALARTRRAIKTALLDQTLVAGLGNIYADEALFEAKIHPQVPANRLKKEQVAELTKAIKSVLKRALHHKGSTLRDYRDADGLPGEFQKLHRVYDRAGRPCVHCGTPLKRIVLGGRSTHFCPQCQPRRRRRGQ